MKKIFAMLLALSMLFSFAACGGTTAEPTTPATDAPTDTPEISTGPVVEGNDVTTDISALEVWLNEIIAKQPVEFMGGVMPVDLTDPDGVKYMTGLDSVDGIVEAAVFEPMMGSIAFSLVMVRTAEGTDAKTVAEAMKAGIDQRKWICVEANDLKVATYGDVAMLIMVDSNNGLSAQSYVDAFAQVAGAELDFVA